MVGSASGVIVVLLYCRPYKDLWLLELTPYRPQVGVGRKLLPGSELDTLVVPLAPIPQYMEC